MWAYIHIIKISVVPLPFPQPTIQRVTVAKAGKMKLKECIIFIYGKKNNYELKNLSNTSTVENKSCPDIPLKFA